MSDDKSSLIVEGDYAKVPVQLAGGDAGPHPQRPTPGTQLVWGGKSGPSTPWGHLLSLIEKSGGEVSFTQVHAAAFLDHAHELPRPAGAPGVAPMPHDAGGDKDPAPPDKKDEGGGGKKVEVLPPTLPQHAPGEDHHSGPAGEGPLFEYGVTFPYQGEEAKVWAHPRAANAGPRPLVILLHGMNKTGWKHMALDSLAGKTSKSTPAWIHVGKIAQKLIDDGSVTPLVIAAPTNFTDYPWAKFDLATFVNTVEQKCRDSGVEIDLDQVSVSAHSAGGGYPGRGLNKIAGEKAEFSGHKLKVFGIHDTRIAAPTAAEYAKALKSNDTTIVYSIHKGTGGWNTAEYNASGGAAGWAKGLGATEKNDSQVVATEVMGECDSYYTNGSATPARVSIKVKESALPKYRALWESLGACHGINGAHNDMIPMWCMWALPRFYPQTEADTKLMAAHKAAQEDKPRPPAPAPPMPKGPPTVTGGDPNIPPAPDVWTNPAGDIAPRATGLATFADPTAAVFWPVRAAHHPWKRGVHYTGEDGKVYNYLGKQGSGCHFLAGRGNGRTHVGVDLNFGAAGAIVVACEAGTIVNSYGFLATVNCILIQHDSGIVINYGEVHPNSLKEFNLKIGDRVSAGQPIARVGRCPEGDSMIHFETYPQGTTKNVSYPKGAGKDHLAHYRNPTAYLLYLAKNGR